MTYIPKTSHQAFDLSYNNLVADNQEEYLFSYFEFKSVSTQIYLLSIHLNILNLN